MNRWPSLGELLMWRWFSRFSFRSDGLSWDAHNTSSLLVKHFVFGSWKAITVWLLQSSFTQAFAGVMWSVLMNVVREGTVFTRACSGAEYHCDGVVDGSI